MDFLNNMDEKQKKYFIIAVYLLLGLLSMTLFARLFTSAASTSGTVAYLDEKKKTVLELTAAATTSSAAITMIPGDIGTPIADKLADLSSYTLIVLVAVFLEKYLVTITGNLVFRFLLPAACLFAIANVMNPKWANAKKTAKRVAMFSLVLWLVIPASVKLSQMIEATYETSIQETIDSAKESAEEIQNNSENQTIWNRFISTIEGGISGLTNKFESILNNFIEATAVLLVTACVIPVIVLIIMYWVVKMLFGLDKRQEPARAPAVQP